MTENIDTKAKVYDLLKSFPTAMFVSMGPGGRPEARPMHVAKVEEERGQVWFLTGRGGMLVDEIVKEDRVLLVFQSASAYLSLRGKGRVVEDRGKIKQLWKEPYKVWFPKGPEDPEVALVAVDSTDAEYWDSGGMNKVKYMFEAAKAYVKGERPDVNDPDQHAKTKL